LATFANLENLFGWFNVRAYGAAGDGATDDTAAVQDAIDACAAAGGGTVYFPPGIYQLTTAAYGTPNAQLHLPTRRLDDVPHVSIRLLGPDCPPLTPWSYAHPPTSGAVLRSTATSGSVIGGTSTFTFGGTNLTAVHCTLENLTVRCPGDPECNGVNLANVSGASLKHVLIDTGNYGTGNGTGEDWVECTTTTATGLILPLFNNGAHVSLDNVCVVEWYYGIQSSEHLTAKSVTAFGCKYAMRFMDSYHSIHIDYLGSFFNENGILIDTSGSLPLRLTIDLFSVERQGTGWQSDGVDFIDSENRAWGHCYHTVVKSGVGASTDWRLTGGTNMTFTAIGGGAS
jgi:hypothetical protein